MTSCSRARSQSPEPSSSLSISSRSPFWTPQQTAQPFRIVGASLHRHILSIRIPNPTAKYSPTPHSCAKTRNRNPVEGLNTPYPPHLKTYLAQSISLQPTEHIRRRLPACSTRSNKRASMHPFSILTLGIFVAGYITARWDLVTRLYELAIFAWDYGVVVSACSQLDPAIVQRYCSNILIFKHSPVLPKPSLRSVSSFSSSLSPWNELRQQRRTWYEPADPHALGHDRKLIYFREQHPRSNGSGISAREQLRRRGSF